MVATNYTNATTCDSGNFVFSRDDTSGLTPTWIIIDDQVFTSVSAGSNYGTVVETVQHKKAFVPTRRQFIQPPQYAAMLQRFALNAQETRAKALMNSVRFNANAKSIQIKSPHTSQRQKRRDFLMKQKGQV